MIPTDLMDDYLIDVQIEIGTLSPPGERSGRWFEELLTWFLNLVLQLEAIQQAGADPYQRSESRKAHRNGCKDR